ncbi:MAG: cupin domain-containing protein [Chloroflexi bacterium]|nr:cupin domain-containing protein [Chloroflexota bacterium]
MATVRPPQVGTYELIQDYDSPAATVRVFRMRNTGDAVKPHVHAKSAQIYVAIEGALEVVIDGASRVIRPFETAYVPVGKTHGARPAGDSAVVMNISIPPLAADDQVAVPAAE